VARPSDPYPRSEPVPFTRKGHESWAKERRMGQTRFIRHAALSGASIVPVTLGSFAGLLAICGKIEITKVPVMLVVFYALLASVFGAVVGGIKGRMTYQNAEERFAATKQTHLDDQALLDEERTNKTFMWLVSPGALLALTSIFLPDRFFPLLFVGFGMMSLSIALSPASFERPMVSRVFVLVGGIAMICLGVFLL